MKRWFVYVLTFAVLVFAGGVVGHTNVAEAAKSYKSGTKSFDTNKSTTTPGDSINKSSTSNPSNSTTNPVKPMPNATTQKGGLLKGLFLGGMAGLLFGSIFSHFGGFGMILGLLVNVITIFLVVMLVRGMINYFKNNRKKKENQLWKR